MDSTIAEADGGVEPNDDDHPLFQRTLLGLTEIAETVLGESVTASAESDLDYDLVLLAAGTAHVLDTAEHVELDLLRWWVEATDTADEFELVCPHGFIADVFEGPAFRMRFRASFSEADEIESVHLLSISDGSE